MTGTHPRSGRTLRIGIGALALLAAAGRPLPGGAAPATGEPIVLREGLAVPGVVRAGRSALHLDAVEAQIVAGRWQAPRAGEGVTVPWLPAGQQARTWEAVRAGDDGWFSGRALSGGYLYVPVESPEPRVMVLEAAGQGMVYVNGEPRAGDPYATGYVRLPVALRAGRNDFLFQGGRGRVQARLVPAAAPAMLNLADPTVPDLVEPDASPRDREQWAAVVVLNATAGPAGGLALRARLPGGGAVRTPLPELPPLGVRKVGFRFQVPPDLRPADEKQRSLPLSLELLGAGGRVLANETLPLRLRRPEQTRKVTFRSEIDGSVQYYAVNPAPPPVAGRGPERDSRRPALFLTLHGAGVEAIGQADAYSPKQWGHLVAPTNRRPYGFDWEDWGRVDAMEVLAHAAAALGTDPQRTYLTGHSMGGHGAWQIAVTFPDRFAAVGPSAGWVSFSSYGGGVRIRDPAPALALVQRSGNPSDTLALVRNLEGMGVYVLHGDADDNVPVSQARTMVAALQPFHHDLTVHEQKGAGHWWDASDEPGADCVDWQPLFDLFARRILPAPASLRQVDFTTASPGVSGRCFWATIVAQERMLEPATIRLRWDPGQRRVTGTTGNVRRLEIDLASLGAAGSVRLEIDGQKLEAPAPGSAVPGALSLDRSGGTWAVTAAPPAGEKNPRRYGPFKGAFLHRFMLVYGTRGTPEENAWALAKARYDAETWWVRGNGSVDVIPDTEFDPRREPDRSVVLYGNADTNGAWPALLADSPVQVRRGSARIGEREVRADDLAALFLRPRRGSPAASVAVVGGTGPAGMRLADRLPYFVSGVAYPDCTLIGPEMLTRPEAGIRAAGFFGVDWGVGSGEFAWAPEERRP